MNRIAEIALVVAIACIGAAHMIGATMARLVEQRTGRSYRFPAASTKLAKDYRLHFGADRNYVYYGLLHYASLGLGLTAALLSALCS